MHTEHSDWPAIISALSAVAIAFLTLAYFLVTRKMLREISKQGDTSQIQMGEMIRQSEMMRLQWREAHEQVGNMDRQLTEMAKQTNAMAQQTNAMWEQLRLTIAKELPRLLIDLPGQEFSPHEHASQQIMKLTITHYGESEAYNVSGEGAVIVSSSYDFPTADTLLHWMDGIPQVIKPGDSPVEASLLLIPTLRLVELVRIREQLSFLHFLGEISYQDLLNNPMRLPFWYSWRVVFDTPVEGGPTVDLSYWEFRVHPHWEEKPKLAGTNG